MTLHSLMPFVFVAALAACSPPSARYLIEPPATDVKVRAAVASLMLRDVSLPAYAAAEDILRQEKDGALREAGAAIWADQPVRGITLALARQLDTMMTATVAAEPWPLIGLADAVLEVRVEQMIAGADGEFRLSGQYFISGDAAALHAISESFDVRVPISGDGPGGIVAAQSQAIGKLAEQIARKLAR